MTNSSDGDQSSFSDDDAEKKLDVSFSPLKNKPARHLNGNPRCLLVDLESRDNVDVVPILMNGKDTPNLISNRVPSRCQENASFIIDLDVLENRKDVYSDDNGVRRPTGCKSKMFNVERGAGGKVVNLIKVGKGQRSGFHDVTVCRHTYVCLSCPSFHKTLVTVEYGKDIQ